MDSAQSNYDTQNDSIIDISQLTDNLSGINLKVNNQIMAGSTMRQFTRNIDILNSNDNMIPPHTYSNCDADTFLLRVGPNYMKFKQKAPSLKSLYEVVGVDFVRCTERIDNFVSKVQIPTEWTDNISVRNPHIPPLFVVNAQLPEDFSTSFFTTSKEDGLGWSLVVYFRITQETCEALQDLNTASPAIKLFAKYCYEAPEAFSINNNTTNNNDNTNTTNNTNNTTNNNTNNNTTNTTTNNNNINLFSSSCKNSTSSSFLITTNNDNSSSSSSSSSSSKLMSKAMSFTFSSVTNRPSSATTTTTTAVSLENPWIGRFKILLRCDDIEKFGLPSFITSYNAKPVLIRNTGTLIRGTNYIEMDINIHKFASVPKKALEVLFHRFDQMKISMGFCIESRDDDEMPETLLGAVKINLPSYQKAYNWNTPTL